MNEAQRIYSLLVHYEHGNLPVINPGTRVGCLSEKMTALYDALLAGQMPPAAFRHPAGKEQKP